MSITMQQILVDAKKLVDRLKDHDNFADYVITQAHDVKKSVDAMKQYQEDIEELNEVARHEPRALLIQGIQQENRQIRELQQENRELRGALEEHQSAMELIMSKYREHVVSLLKANKMDQTIVGVDRSNKLIQKQANKIDEMMAVMNKAVVLVEDGFISEREQLVQLNTENKGLREMLNISAKNGSYLNFPEMVDKEVQTEPSNDDDDNCSDNNPES